MAAEVKAQRQFLFGQLAGIVPGWWREQGRRMLIGLIRAMSDQYIETRWTNVVVFGVLILILVFRPSGLLGLKQREKV